MVELIKARIAFYGGREQLIKDILQEWMPAPDKALQASLNGLQTWSGKQEKMLGKEVRYKDLNRLALKIGKSKEAVEDKAKRMGVYVKSSVKH